jgi:hypothetical protein
MMDPVVLKALQEKRELQRRLAEIEQFLRLYREFSGANIQEESIHSDPDMSRMCVGNTAEAARAVQAARNSIVHRLTPRGPKTVARFSETILREAGHPLTRGDIAAELEARGVHLPGGGKEARARYVGTILWRFKDVFENIESKGYWLKDVLMPESELDRKALRESNRIFDASDEDPQ